MIFFELIRATNEEFLAMEAKKDSLKKKQEDVQSRQRVIEPFRPIDGELDKILSYKYIAYRFWKNLPAEQYQKNWKRFLDERSGRYFVKGQQDESMVYGAYFVSPAEAHKCRRSISVPAF